MIYLPLQLSLCPSAPKKIGLHLYDTAQRSASFVKHAEFWQGLNRQTCSGGTDNTTEFPVKN